jgi:phosphoenolpyruvate carboxykinase (GTP)
VRGLDLSPEAVAELLRVDTQTWGEELPLLREHLAKFGDRLPPALTKQLDALGRRLAAYQAP